MKVLVVECDHCGQSQPYHGQRVCDNCKHIFNNWAISAQLRHLMQFMDDLKKEKEGEKT